MTGKEKVGKRKQNRHFIFLMIPKVLFRSLLFFSCYSRFFAPLFCKSDVRAVDIYTPGWMWKSEVGG